MKVFLASDHAGFELKEKIKSFLLKKGYEIEDCGAYGLDASDDYPDFIQKAAINVSKNSNSRGIIFGKSGAGETIVANKIKEIRAIQGFCKKNVSLGRLDNDANILSLGSAFVNEKLAEEFILIFLETDFSNEKRHIRRIAKIKEIEEKWSIR